MFSFAAYALELCTLRFGFRELANVFVCHVPICFLYILFVGCNVHNLCKKFQNSRAHGELATVFTLIHRVPTT